MNGDIKGYKYFSSLLCSDLVCVHVYVLLNQRYCTIPVSYFMMNDDSHIHIVFTIVFSMTLLP